MKNDLREKGGQLQKRKVEERFWRFTGETQGATGFKAADVTQEPRLQRELLKCTVKERNEKREMPLRLNGR